MKQSKEGIVTNGDKITSDAASDAQVPVASGDAEEERAHHGGHSAPRQGDLFCLMGSHLCLESMQGAAH